MVLCMTSPSSTLFNPYLLSPPHLLQIIFYRFFSKPPQNKSFTFAKIRQRWQLYTKCDWLKCNINSVEVSIKNEHKMLETPYTRDRVKGLLPAFVMRARLISRPHHVRLCIIAIHCDFSSESYIHIDPKVEAVVK